MSKFLGESKSAKKRRARRWGVCVCCGRSVCMFSTENKKSSPFPTKSNIQVCYALNYSPIRYITEREGSFVDRALEHQIDDAEAGGYDVCEIINGRIRSKVQLKCVT